jgi:hypothetical protein
MGGQRSTQFMDVNQVHNAFRAFGFSDLIDLPLQTPVTVVWSQTRNRPDTVDGAFIRYKERAQKWLGRRGTPLTAVYVHENGLLHGLHTHMLVHVPSDLQEDFAARSLVWADAKRKTAVQLRTSRGDGPRGWLRYICKGINDTDHDSRIVAEQYGIIPDNKGQGWVPFKRAGVTENIGWTARAKHDLRFLPTAA